MEIALPLYFFFLMFTKVTIIAALVFLSTCLVFVLWQFLKSLKYK